MEFPNIDFRDETACFMALFKLVHPAGPRCPHCGAKDDLRACRRHKNSWIVDFRCPHCGRVFNAWTGTPFQRTHHSPSELCRIVKRIKEGTFKAEMAREFDCQRAHLSEFCHRIQKWVTTVFGPPPKKSPRKRPGRTAKKRPTSRKGRS
jgi:transposase-like protein